MGELGRLRAGQGVEARGTRFERAFTDAQHALKSVDLSNYVEPDFELTQGVCLALDAVPRIIANRHEFGVFRGEAGRFQHHFVDELEARALCAGHACARYEAIVDAEGMLEDALVRAHPLRELLCANTRVLALHGVVSREVAAGFRERHGYQDIAAELLALEVLWSELLVRLDGKTLIRRLHLIEAECHADQLILALAARGCEFSPETLALAEQERRAAVALFADAYDGIRAALSYVFHDRDNGVSVAPALTWHDKRWVRICELERAMSTTERTDWDPEWQAELDLLHQVRSR